MEAFVIDWSKNGDNGTLFTSAGLVITYTNEKQIDDKIIYGKIYGFLNPQQVKSLHDLLEDTRNKPPQPNNKDDEDTYIGYIFYKNDRVDKIILDRSLIDEIQTLQYKLA